MSLIARDCWIHFKHKQAPQQQWQSVPEKICMTFNIPSPLSASIWWAIMMLSALNCQPTNMIYLKISHIINCWGRYLGLFTFLTDVFWNEEKLQQTAVICLKSEKKTKHKSLHHLPLYIQCHYNIVESFPLIFGWKTI